MNKEKLDSYNKTLVVDSVGEFNGDKILFVCDILPISKKAKDEIDSFIRDICPVELKEISRTTLFKNEEHPAVTYVSVTSKEVVILRNQINLLKPKVIIVIGTASRNALTLIRKKALKVRHPSYLLRYCTENYSDEVAEYRKQLIELVGGRQTELFDFIK